ncbi:type II secretion system F family protein [Halodesulfovibrio sp.]|jgi:general secretion pathway protein F|uniref:type II secretion system F family protein n=1 Tax=Halodesulfovibrio sp. TaxID=1912772 RepID=UPI0025EDF28A|nr:type II secretion system F family protein [Halodesulfovibrio sp.]MCT4535216.1 type II secretion system F family protein [Halodesulfovibrio sp.]
MSKFIYSAVTQSGETKKGTLTADSKTQALEQLHRQGLFPLDVSEAKAKKSMPSLLQREFITRRALSLKELQDILERMHILLGSGLPLEDVLILLVEQGGSATVQRVLAQALSSVQEGSSLSTGMEQTKAFPDAVIATIRAGEASGNLSGVVDKLAEQTERSVHLHGKVRSAMAYPGFLLLFCIAVVVFLLAVVVPQLSEIFMDMQKQLPTSTAFLIAVGEWFTHWYWTIPAAVLLFSIGFKLGLKRPAFRLAVHSMLLRVPVIGNAHRLRVVSQFSGIMHVLLLGGVPLLSALRVASSTGGSAVLETQLGEVDEGLKAGRSFVQLLHDDIFSAQELRILDAGEQSGKLDSMFAHISRGTETELRRTLTTALSLVEPMLILFMGSIVGFVVLAIFLPILDMSQLQ